MKRKKLIRGRQNQTSRKVPKNDLTADGTCDTVIRRHTGQVKDAIQKLSKVLKKQYKKND